MGLVTDIMTKLDTSVQNTGQLLFEGTADAMMPIMTIFLTISLLLLGMNMALGVVRMDARSSVQIGTRIIMIYIFAFSWANFGAVYEALSSASGNLALNFFTTTDGSINGAVDDFSVQMSDVADGAAKSMGSIARGVLAAIFTLILAILMAAYVLIVGFAKIMIAMLLGVAPIAIVCSIFDRTKPMFEAWLSSFVSYLMYPIAAAAVMATVIVVSKDQFRDQEEVKMLAEVLGFLVVVLVGLFALVCIPTAATNLTGQMHLANFAPQAMSLARSSLSLPGRGLKAAGAPSPSLMLSGALGSTGTNREVQGQRERSAREAGAYLRSKISSMAKLRR